MTLERSLFSVRRLAAGAFACVAVLWLSGCSSTYLTPGPKADLQEETPADLQAGFAAKPTLKFPASIVAMHVQGPAYNNFALGRRGGAVDGGGRYTVVTTRDDAEQAELERLGKLPQVAGLASVNRMLLPERISSERDLRVAASRLQADVVWLYTFDTRFFDNDQAKPLTVVTLGLAPTHKISVSTVASALLVDTRTGYVYGAYEATAQAQTLASSWGSQDSTDEQRQLTERDAFSKPTAEFSRSWPGLVARHSAGS